MSSDEEDLDLNDDTTSQNENMTDDGLDGDDPDPSTQGSPAPTLQDAMSQKQRVQIHVDPDMLTCSSYDYLPLAAAVHPSAIFSLAMTRCFRWVFTGSDDGYIRKWDFFASMNGKTMLTQAQRHHHDDSVTNAGVLSSWWENEEYPDPAMKTEGHEGEAGTPSAIPPSTREPKLSPVYSLDVQSEALWALQGTENGSINLVTVRHDEGKCHHVLRKHTSPVSVIRIVPGETAAISGSWDKSVLEWDLNTGAVVRSYAGHGSQLSSVAFQPLFQLGTLSSTPSGSKGTTSNDTNSAAMDMETDANLVWDRKNPDIFFTTSVDGQVRIWDRRDPEKEAQHLPLPDKTPPWCLSACWNADGSKIYVGRRNGLVDEWDMVAHKHLRSFRMPANSGPVSYLASMPDGKHIICASNDNIRLWNTAIESPFTVYPDGSLGQKTKSTAVPFFILPGHHGGCISQIAIDPTCRYMITTSGNRGWDGVSTNACLFYDIAPVMSSS